MILRLFVGERLYQKICRCPAKSLHVERNATEVQEKDGVMVTYHMTCLRCGKQHDIGFFKWSALEEMGHYE